jgi:hypothetical protein
VAALAALVSPDDRQSAFVIASETDYVQIISAIRLMAIVVGDFETLFARAYSRIGHHSQNRSDADPCVHRS